MDKGKRDFDELKSMADRYDKRGERELLRLMDRLWHTGFNSNVDIDEQGVVLNISKRKLKTYR